MGKKALEKWRMTGTTAMTDTHKPPVRRAKGQALSRQTRILTRAHFLLVPSPGDQPENETAKEQRRGQTPSRQVNYTARSNIITGWGLALSQHLHPTALGQRCCFHCCLRLLASSERGRTKEETQHPFNDASPFFFNSLIDGIHPVSGTAGGSVAACAGACVRETQATRTPSATHPRRHLSLRGHPWESLEWEAERKERGYRGESGGQETQRGNILRASLGGELAVTGAGRSVPVCQDALRTPRGDWVRQCLPPTAACFTQEQQGDKEPSTHLQRNARAKCDARVRWHCSEHRRGQSPGEAPAGINRGSGMLTAASGTDTA